MGLTSDHSVVPLRYPCESFSRLRGSYSLGTKVHALVLSMYKIVLIVLCIVGNSPFRCLSGPTVFDTPWSKGPVHFLGDAMVFHWVNMYTFIAPHVFLHGMLDINFSCGKLKLR